jgi:hypothetical protein
MRLSGKETMKSKGMPACRRAAFLREDSKGGIDTSIIETLALNKMFLMGATGMRSKLEPGLYILHL